MHFIKCGTENGERKRKRKRETGNGKCKRKTRNRKKGAENKEREIRTGNIVLTRGVFGPVSLTSHFQQLCKRLTFKVKNYRIL